MIKIGVVGIGNMGTSHARNLYENKVPGAKLSAICDISKARRDYAKEAFKFVKIYDAYEDMLKGDIDAVIVATPHYDHPAMGISALESNLHVLVEKPIGVYTKAVKDLNEASKKSDKIFTIMYNQRTNPLYKKVRELVQSGKIGVLIRVHWICTDWFRTQSYYDSGGWRATWKGEGGGVLLNQCPHQLDLLQWICGMPKSVRSFMSYGKYHDIEVEDDVTTYMEYENGASGLFVTSTGEAPGVNRLEISGSLGRLLVENGKIVFYKNEVDMIDHLNTSKEGFKKPDLWVCEIQVEGEETGHVGIMKDFVNAISGSDQLSPGEEGIHGLTLSNAMHLSSWTDSQVTLPIDEDLFERLLQERVEKSKMKDVESTFMDVRGSH
ncbi:Gfo/Idh/MocA family oxidoreductase [Acidaminobacter sp. JC074]|uniref:Gfo/Idh/MocA family protein n=1 Tax=Acidaminobacter sp. JC074 TaxID=2530199 RepID=UPI001F0E4667|nr:Gfo/Idh/MocA family oxidoreductase [Acidaminobacter sp. JC074]MCH4887017.1 Gfo/Idh/MocA family oxidoreductase [Acidaminobacter sp. JC074]